MFATYNPSTNMLDGLYLLVRNLGRDDIASVQSLVSKVTGNRNAAAMAMQLLHWFPRATHEDGWVFKSWRDWFAECDLSQGQVKRVHSNGYLESIGIQRTVKKARGVPTNHYWLDAEAFISRIADFLETTVTQVKAWMDVGGDAPIQPAAAAQCNGTEQPNTTGQDSPTDWDGDDPMEWAAATQSITNIQTQQQTAGQQAGQTRAAVLSLMKLGIDQSKADKLVRHYGAERVAGAVRKARSPEVKNPAGCAIAALKGGWDRPAERQQVQQDDPSRYVSGKYAAFIIS